MNKADEIDQLLREFGSKLLDASDGDEVRKLIEETRNQILLLFT